MTALSLTLYSNNFNGSMSASFFTAQKMLQKTTVLKHGDHIFDFDIDLPCTLNVLVNGKDNSKDTVVDDKGNILEDKFIRIDKICLDNKPLNDNALPKFCKLVTNDSKTIVSNYIGFNGMVSLDLNYSDSLVAHISIQKLLG